MEYDFWEDLKESIEEIRLGELEEKALFDFIRYTIGNSLPTEKGKITVERKEDSFTDFIITIKDFRIECNSLGKIKFTHKVPGKGIYHLENIGGNGMSIPDSSKLDKYSVRFYSQEEIEQAERLGKSFYSLGLGTELEKRIEIGELDGDFERGIDIKTGYDEKKAKGETLQYDFWKELKVSIEEIQFGELEEKAFFDFIRYAIGNSLPTEPGQITVKRKEDSAFPTFLIEIKGFTIECNSLGKIKFTHKVPGKGIYHLENIGGNGMSIPDSSKLDKYSVSFYSQEEIEQAEKEGKSVYSLELGTKLEKRIEIGELDGDFERGIDIKTGYKPKQQTSEVKEPKSMSLPREDIIEKIAEGISYHNIFLSHDYGQPILLNFLEQALGTMAKNLTPPISVQVVPPSKSVSSKLLEGTFKIIIKSQEGTIKIDCNPDGLFVCDANMKEKGRYVMTNTDEISLISTSKPQKQRVAVRYYDPKSSHEMSTDNMIATIPAEYYQVIPTEQLGGDFTKCINQLLEKEEAPGRKGR